MPDVRTSEKPKALLCLLLHAHLPFVRHPEHPEFLEERWLFEAVRECYLPLIRILRAREDQPSVARMAISLSPTLVAMLEDKLLRARITRYLERVSRFADAEVTRTRGDERFHPLAIFYQSLAGTNLETWNNIQCDVVTGFLQAEKRGQIELLTTAATHAFLPIWQRHPEVLRMQIRVGVESFAARAGHRPAGFWLPECGYFNGLEHMLADEGIRYFITESHGLLHGHPSPPHGIYEPVVCPNGVVAFGRDPDSSRQVWSAQSGYPGDPDYREYYRDVGTTLDPAQLETIFPLARLDPSTGFKYHRVTGTDEAKQMYDPVRAAEKTRMHAADFIEKKLQKVRALMAPPDRGPLFMAPYDAELFGHWWFEGPLFIEHLMEMCSGSGEIGMITPSDYLEQSTGPLFESTPSASTWGARGYSGSWVNDATAWLYPPLFRAVDEHAGILARAGCSIELSLRERLVRQMKRELMLAQSSDWPFMMNAGHHGSYAEKRIRDHLARYYWLAGCLTTGVVDQERLRAIESADCIFTDRDLGPVS